MNNIIEFTEDTQSIDALHGSLALFEIIILANEEMNIAKQFLEVEENGRKVAHSQGKISGIKKLISAICAEFHLNQYAVEDNGEKSTIHPDLDDAIFEGIKISRNLLVECEEWKAVMDRIQALIDQAKDYLYFSAEKTRELDIAQGQYDGMMTYKQLFDAIDNEVLRREKEAAQKKEELAFDDKEDEK